MLKQLFFSVFFCCCLISLQAQTEEISFEISNDTTSIFLATLDSADYVFHKVNTGETAYAIKKQYGISVEDLYTHNPKAKSGLQIGEILLIPKAIIIKQKAVETPKFVYHIVHEGESIISISELYECSIADIKNINSDTIHYSIGEKIRIPYDINKPQNTIQPTAKVALKTNEYRVRPKETIWGITHRFNITEEALYAANLTLKKEGLKAGQVITIPITNIVKINEDKTLTPPQDTVNYHEIVKGETLYSIARNYRTPIDTLMAYNPLLTADLTIGQLILLPTIENRFNYITHRSTKKEKVNDIAKNYSIPVNEIKRLNPHITKKIRKGGLTLIPLEKRVVEVPQILAVDSSKTTFELDSCSTILNTETTFNIVLLVPLKTDELTETTFDYIHIRNKVENYPFFRFIQFIEGCQLALDSLAERGMKCNLFVYDLNRDIEKAKALVKEDAMLDADLIIAFTYANTFKIIADFAKNNHKPLINPISKRSNIVKGYPSVFKISPSDNMLPNYVTSLIPTDRAVNIITVRADKYRETISMTKLHDALARWKEAHPYSTTTIHETVYMRDSIAGIIAAADSTKQNILIAVSDDELFAMELTRTASEYSNSLDLTLISYPNWNQFQKLETSYQEQLNMHFIGDKLIDYHDSQVKNFIQNFRAKFNAEPNNFAYLGFDVFFYFVQSLGLYGNNMEKCLEETPYKPMMNLFEFSQQLGDGFENHHWNCYYVDNKKQITIDN